MPDDNQGVTATADAPPDTSTSSGGEATKAPEGFVPEKRYEDSSREAQRLFGESQRLQGELDAARRSLKERDNQENQPQGFVPEDDFVKKWIEKGIPEDAARFMYQDRSQIHSAMQFMMMQNQAMANRMKFAEENSNKLSLESNPAIKQAVEFWKDVPAVAALPISEQADLYRKKFQSSTGNRDLSAVKGAASSPAGGGGRGSAPSFTAEQDTEARAANFPSAQAMKEYVNVQTEDQDKQWRAKWIKKS